MWGTRCQALSLPHQFGIRRVLTFIVYVIDLLDCCRRFNGFDGRLERELETVVLVMEAFQGYEARLQYDIVGHSGEDHSISFVSANKPPANNKERLEVIRVSF